MWFMYAIITIIAWALADVFYKKGNINIDPYSHYKTGIIVGIIMGIHATIYLIINNLQVNLIDLIKYLPVSLCYIISMVVGYNGLKYLELTISSPIQNSSGVITSLLLCMIFSITLSDYEVLGILIVFIGVLLLSLTEIEEERKGKVLKQLKISAIIFPLLYCLIDGLGTFLDAVYLDQLSLISEDSALLCYEYTFLMYGIIMLIYLKLIKKQKLNIFKEKSKVVAAIFETLGQFTYVFAITTHSVITVPIIACYSALSVLLSRFMLKEKLSKKQYIYILIIFIGIIILGVVEGMV